MDLKVLDNHKCVELKDFEKFLNEECVTDIDLASSLGFAKCLNGYKKEIISITPKPLTTSSRCDAECFIANPVYNPCICDHIIHKIVDKLVVEGRLENCTYVII